MSRATLQMREYARRLIAFEAKVGPSPADPAAFPISDKLRPQLAMLMGAAGFRALLSRALALAKSEVPSLRAIRVSPEGGLEGWEKLHARLDADKSLEGRIVLLAQLLGLLVTFIGENLTLHVVREVWPKLRLNDVEVGKGDKK